MKNSKRELMRFGYHKQLETKCNVKIVAVVHSHELYKLHPTLKN